MVKMGIDLAMTVLLLCQMSYLLIGETAHEWMGTAMFVLFLLHHALNREWYQNLGKGRYSALRIFQTAVDFLVFLAMLGLMISGIMISRVVFSFLPYAVRVLGIPADGRSYWTALGDDYGNGAQDVRRDKDILDPFLGAARSDRRNLCIWNFFFWKT